MSQTQAKDSRGNHHHGVGANMARAGVASLCGLPTASEHAPS